jgi:hypothetical protein
MNETRILVTFASWEDRFRLGVLQECERRHPTRVLQYYLNGFAERTQANRLTIQQFCQKQNIEFFEKELKLESPWDNWRILNSSFQQWVSKGSRVTVDFSTMPREYVWETFWLLDLLKATTDFIYNCPERYGDEWLSRDPERPRLVYKMSGIAKPGLRTALIVIAGYDIERTEQLVNFFEPAITLLGLQSGNADVQNADKMRQQRAKFERNQAVRLFPLDAFGPDQGQTSIESQVLPLLERHNVIMSSLGPKPSAVALYRIQRANEEIGLAYAPSKEFSPDYSRGIGRTITGTL